MTARRGLFITLEGGEGAGKSTLAQRLAELLRRQGYSVVLTREPAGTALGRLIKSLFEESLPIIPVAELFLFEAARAHHVAEVIRPALERGDIVICDRFTDSTLAYQGYGRGLNLDDVRAANEIASQGLLPDLTVLLDVPAEVGLARAEGRPTCRPKDQERIGDRIGRESLEFHQRVRQGYLTLAERDPHRFLVVDAALPRQKVTEAIWERLRPLLEGLRPRS